MNKLIYVFIHWFSFEAVVHYSLIAHNPKFSILD